MLEQFPTGTRVDLDKQEKALERFGAIAFGGFGVVFGAAMLAMIYVIITKMVLSGSQPIAGVFLIAVLIFAALSLTYVIWRESLKEKRKKMETAPGLNAYPPNSTVSLLNDARFEPVPSVTEDTTALLGVERKTKELE